MSAGGSPARVLEAAIVLAALAQAVLNNSTVVCWCCLLTSVGAVWLQVKRYRQQGGLAGPDGIKSVFGQLCSRWHTLKPEDLLLPHRIWKVKFVGESVDDVGGGYSESIAEMCEELQNGAVPILIPTPNGREETGVNRDCFILNPEATSPIHLNMFRFLGVLLGIAIRSGSPVDLQLAPPVWKQLVGETLTLQDLSEVDSDYIQGLLYLQVHTPYVPFVIYCPICV